MLVTPNISAVEYNIVNDSNQEKISDNFASIKQKSAINILRNKDSIFQTIKHKMIKDISLIDLIIIIIQIVSLALTAMISAVFFLSAIFELIGNEILTGLKAKNYFETSTFDNSNIIWEKLLTILYAFIYFFVFIWIVFASIIAIMFGIDHPGPWTA